MNNFFNNLFFGTKRIYGLDILRSVAILMVLYEHSSRFITKWGFAKHYLDFYLDAVSIFFVLSGFLIGKIIITSFNTDNIKFKQLLNFWKNRWFRTLPNYFFILIIIFIFFKFKNIPFPNQAYEYLFFIECLTKPHPLFFPEAWSLTVEEWFYLLIPFLLLILSKFKFLSYQKSFLVLIFTIIFFSFFVRLYRVINVIDPLDWNRIIRMQVITRLDSIMFGVLSAHILVFNYNLWIKLKNKGLYGTLICIIIIKLLPHNYALQSLLRFPLESIMIVFALPYLYDIKVGQGFFYKFLTIINILSYSIYLINYTLIYGLILNGFNIDYWQYSMQESLIKFTLFWFLSITIAIIPFILIEKPFLKFRNMRMKHNYVA